MISRCHFDGDPAYEDYGGRGIIVCVRWRCLGGFANFVADMRPRPSRQHSLDRKNNDAGYEPENCRWATRTEQARNRRNNRLLTIDGLTAPVASWAEKSGVSRRIITDRLEAGWEPKRAVFKPGRLHEDIAIGNEFSRWTVIGIKSRNKYGNRRYECRCACGEVRVLRGYDLRTGKTKSCRACSMRGNQHAR